MSRLADYFVVVGYDHEKERSNNSNGAIVQRFPEKDWPDTPFIDGIEWFCQPLGWALSSERQEPKFFVYVLTDIDCNRHYCACLCFNETVSITPSKPADERYKFQTLFKYLQEEDNVELENSRRAGSLTRNLPAVTHHSIMYAPKCLVLVSRLDYIETFRNCLGVVYTAFLDDPGTPLETLVGNILGCVQVPPPGGPQVRFSIGAGDRQALQPPLSASLPVTGSSVSLLFHQFGIRNVLSLLCAIMTEHKILIHSKSYSRLTEGCRALIALMYPFKQSHVYIPVLPANLLEVLSTPTPFLMGIHSSLKGEVADLADVIVADMDGGAVTVPEGLHLPLFPEPLMTQSQDSLMLVLQPELSLADLAFAPLALRPASSSTMLDKELRAVFMRTLAHLLQGYRSCLTTVRIHPKPLIAFNKAAFLSERGLTDCDFTTRLLDCMFFTAFVQERGPPWRVCDLWDELYSNLGEQLRQEAQDSSLVLTHIQDLAKQLHVNENPNPQPYVQKIGRPPEGASSRIHQPRFPLLSSELVQKIIDEEQTKGIKCRLNQMRLSPPRIVPMGSQVSNIQDNSRQIITNSARRLEVLKNCINCIFENKISDARKTFPAVLRALKAKQARLALCTELSQHVLGNKAMLEHQQFDLIVRLMNCALQDDSVMDGHGVAAALLPLATAFCRKLCTGVIQFAYTCIQDHKIWKNQQFWESSFFHDVQRDIKALYLSKPEAMNSSPLSRRSVDRDSSLSPEYPWKDRRSTYIRQIEPSALEIAAEQMRVWPNYDPEKKKEYISSEESTLYSQAIHYANRMVYLLVPLDIGAKWQHSHRGERHHHGEDDDRASNSITNSMIESDSLDAESGFEEQDPSEIGNNVIKTVTRFVDKVSTEGNISADHIRSLHQMIPGVVHMHVETLEAVYRESKRLPPVQKPKIMEPTMLPGEVPIIENLRVFLLPDGREDASGALGGPTLLPAEGALFLTNYRVVFRGTPCDPYVSEQIIVRAFPITSLTKEKRISGVNIQSSLDQMVQEGLQLRSCTFQLIKVAFDEEVTTEMIEAFRKSVHKAKNPMHPFHYFAMNGHAIPETIVKDKEKNATLKGFAKKTLLKTARRAGLKSKNAAKKQKYVLSNAGGNNNKYLTSPGRMSLPPNGFDLSEYPEEDNESREDLLEELDLVVPSGSPGLSDAKTLERLSERSYVRDWSRLGLCADTPTSALSNGAMHRQRTEPFRISTVNHAHMFCYSYPAMLVVPYNVSDDSIRRLTRCHRINRIPVVTWRHPRTKALLLRGSSFHGKGVIGMFKGHQTTTAVSTSESVASNVEQEKFLNAIVQATPAAFLKQGSSAWGMTESSLSIDSLLITMDSDHHVIHGTTPEQTRKVASNPFAKMVAGTLGRKSGGKTASMAFGRWGSLKDRRQSSQASLPTLTVPPKSSQRYSTDSDSGTECVHTLQRAALYIFGEKSQMKGVKTDSGQKIDYIPVEYYDVKNTKNSFKKLMRACVPSSVSSEPDQSFAKLVEGSEWLVQLQSVMQLAGAAVDLLDVQGSSVMICLEDGADITAQISAVAQICLDPYYRTLEGFRVLIEKEWLAFGHKFAQRSTLTEESAESGFAPIFLQFLDIVHQIQRQFPLAFEFNEFYLRFLAYHYVSCRFRTFLFDSERERVMNGIAALDDKRGSLSSHYKGVDTGSDDDSFYPGGRLAGQSSCSPNLGQSVFDYIEKQHARSPIFYNFFFTPDTENPVLRPQSHLSNLDVWDYYLGEELCHGPSYDLEIVQQDAATAEGDKEIASISHDSGRTLINKNIGRLVTSGYDGVAQCIPDSFSYLLEETHRCEIDLERLPLKWRQIWDKLELPPTDSFNSRQHTMTQQLVRLHGRLLHKRSTIEILMKGKLVNASTAVDTASVSGSAASSTVGVAAAASGYSRPHRFDHYDFRTPSYCDQCSNILWGAVKTGVRCKDCGYSCHERCIAAVVRNCPKFRPGSTIDGAATLQPSKHAGDDTRSVNSNVTPSNQQYYDQFSSNVAENRTHEGHLYKRGALLKGWKMRWFVLDSIKHQLRYYDSMEDPACKGVIDLADVASVCQGPPAPVPPKKTDDKSFFDVKTSRRTYNLCACNEAAALEWIEKIQACLQ